MGKTYPVQEVAGRIELVQGPLGAGKTTFAARLARKVGRMYGLELVSNAELGDDWQLCTGWAHMSEFRNAVVLLDEVHLTIPSDRSLSTTAMLREAVEALTYVRKRRQMVIGTAQRWSSVSAVYKELATRFIQVRPMWTGRLHWAFDVPRDQLRREHHNQSKLPLSLYNPRSSNIDTFAEVTPWWSYERGSGRVGG
jgi:hypothetical protein